MVTNGSQSGSARRRGAMNIEMIIAISIIITGLLPVSFTILRDQKRLRSLYHRSIAMEIVDGEMELLAAGGWKAIAPGSVERDVTARSAKNLPKGRFLLTRKPTTLRLEWIPEGPGHGGVVMREIRLPADQ